MNTRGIVQLVVLNIGVQQGVISPILFAIFVLMATILTFLTSPILYVLYRRNYDVRKLSVSNVAQDLRDVREGGVDTVEATGEEPGVPTISNGELNHVGSKGSSVQSTRKSIAAMPPNDTFVTFNELISYAEISYDSEGQDSSLPERTNGMSLQAPRRSISMTRF